MIKDALKKVARIIAIVVMLSLLIGTGCINSLMFHPVKGGYGEKTRGYVDIGTNGVKIAAIVLGPERGKKAIIRCPTARQTKMAATETFIVFTTGLSWNVDSSRKTL